MTNGELIFERDTKKVYRCGEKLYKVFAKDYNKADIFNEALNHARVEETGINMPKVLEVVKKDGSLAIGFDFIEGKTLAELFKKTKDEDKINEYMELFVDTQIDMHSKICPSLTKLKDKMYERITESGLSDSLIYDLHSRLNSTPTHRKLCHGDFNPSNIIIGKDKKVYILDWAHATQGNASADVAMTYMLFHLDGREDLAEKYIKMFCEKTHTQLSYVQAWMPIVAASKLSKLTGEKRELMDLWVNVSEGF